jgi:hypothetical protein
MEVSVQLPALPHYKQPPVFIGYNAKSRSGSDKQTFSRFVIFTAVKILVEVLEVGTSRSYRNATRRHNTEELDLKLIAAQLVERFPPFIELEYSSSC